MENGYFGTLKVFEEIVNEEVSYFRAILCEGVVYTLWNEFLNLYPLKMGD